MLYATIADYEQHEVARCWLDDRLNAPIRVGLPWVSSLAFVRISTNPRVFPNPLSVAAAWRRVVRWLDLPTVWIPEPGDRHGALLDGFMATAVTSPGLVADAHLAALAIEHGLTLCSADGDFARFEGLRWDNPLISAAR